MTTAPTSPVTNLQRLEALEVIVREQASRIEKLEGVIAGIAAVFGSGIAAADDRDLDGPKGDEKIRFDPRDWKGPSQKGRTMSRSLPEFLDVYAETMTYFANNQTDAKKAGFDKKTAARALGWARRLRDGWTPPPAPPAPSFGNAPAGSGFGSGSSGGWGDSTGGGFGSGGGFLRDPPPAAPPAPVSGPAAAAADDDDFPFGANVGTPPAPPPPTPSTEDDDDDPPL